MFYTMYIFILFYYIISNLHLIWVLHFQFSIYHSPLLWFTLWLFLFSIWFAARSCPESLEAVAGPVGVATIHPSRNAWDCPRIDASVSEFCRSRVLFSFTPIVSKMKTLGNFRIEPMGKAHPREISFVNFFPNSFRLLNIIWLKWIFSSIEFYC